jgi:HSP20 family protein
MALMRFDPFRDLDRLADQALGGMRNIRTMPMEALRRGDQFIVALDIPGVSPDDVDVTVERNVVDITARRQPVRQEGDEVIIDERPYGEIPVSEQAKPRKVEIGSVNEGRQEIQTGAREQSDQQSESGQQSESAEQSGSGQQTVTA